MRNGLRSSKPSETPNNATPPKMSSIPTIGTWYECGPTCFRNLNAHQAMPKPRIGATASDGEASPSSVSRGRIGAQRVALCLSLREHGDETAVHRVGAEAVHRQPSCVAERLCDAREQDAGQQQDRQQHVDRSAVLLTDRQRHEIGEDGSHHEHERESASLLREQPNRHGHFGRGELRRVERLDQLLGARESRCWVLQEAAIDRVGQRRGQIGTDARHRRQRLGDLLDERLAGGLRGHRHAAGERVVRREPERVEIAAPVDTIAGRLFGAHVLRGTDNFADAREPGVRAPAVVGRGDHAGDAEVHDERAARRPLDHDVVRLDVAVHDAAAVRVRQRVADVLQQPHDLANADGPARRTRSATLSPST